MVVVVAVAVVVGVEVGEKEQRDAEAQLRPHSSCICLPPPLGVYQLPAPLCRLHPTWFGACTGSTRGQSSFTTPPSSTLHTLMVEVNTKEAPAEEESQRARAPATWLSQSKRGSPSGAMGDRSSCVFS